MSRTGLTDGYAKPTSSGGSYAPEFKCRSSRKLLRFSGAPAFGFGLNPPTINRFDIEPPVTTHPEGREASLLQKPIDCRRVYA